MGFLYKAELSNQKVTYKELKIAQHKQILKCFVGEKIAPDILIDNLNSVILENTFLSEKDINELSYIDYFLLVLYMRYTSIGDLIFAEINTGQKTKLEISISKVIDTFNEFIKQEIYQPTSYKNLEVYYTAPTIKSLCKLQDKATQKNFYIYFLKTLKVNNQTFDIIDLPDTDIEIVLNSLPVKATTQIIKQATDIASKLNAFNILNYLPGVEQKICLNLNIENFCMLVRLLFGGDLLGLYENIFALCKYGNFSPEYIEQCTPGEYLFFTKKLEELAKKQSQNNLPSDMTQSPFEDGLS